MKRLAPLVALTSMLLFAGRVQEQGQTWGDNNNEQWEQDPATLGLSPIFPQPSPAQPFFQSPPPKIQPVQLFPTPQLPPMVMCRLSQLGIVICNQYSD